MSSFIGHGLAALTLSALAPRVSPRRWAWTAWLVLLALAPDADYGFPVLVLPGTPPLRTTHSLVGCLALPLLTVVGLRLLRVQGRTLAVRGAQAAGAGLSHVVLDLLVGVTPAALLWPLWDERFRLPFGVLPSAGRPRLDNPLFYRNLLIELGVLVPLFTSLVLARARRLRAAILIGLAAISLGFMAWAASLPR
jgi:hypothetical protein